MASAGSTDELGEKIRVAKEQLDTRGWAVVDDVIPRDDCDDYMRQLQIWKDQFSPNFPSTIFGSLIHEYNVGHRRVPWEVRLKSKPVWAGLWGTEKLLSSVDGIAIGEPPEMGNTKFDDPTVHTLHHDQGPQRKGFHAYQGAVYLEEALEDDWCFAVLENSHNFHQEFFQTHARNPKSEFRAIYDDGLQWYQDRGCHLVRMAIPKGGMVLWDSRTIHMGAPPKADRENPGRWRYVVFVCMAPAIWASPEDLAQKKISYEELRMTNHWPANGTTLFRKYNPHRFDLTKLPEVAKGREARLIAGVESYDFDDGKPNGPQCTPVTVNL